MQSIEAFEVFNHPLNPGEHKRSIVVASSDYYEGLNGKYFLYIIDDGVYSS